MKKTSINIVGSGNVATHLAIALHNAGNNIVQVFSRTFDHAQLLAQRVNATPIDRIDLLSTDVDVYLLSVNDDALFDLGIDLKLPDALVIHTSGSTPISVLKNISRKYGVVWSPQTFVRDIAMDYSSLQLCIEGSTPQTEHQIEQIFSTITHNIHRLDFEQRRRSHLSAVMVSNFVCAINALAQEYMERNNLDFNMLRPLAEQTLKKWDYGNLWNQITGPAARHDEKTINAQRKLLLDNPKLLEFYNLMTDIIENH